MDRYRALQELNKDIDKVIRESTIKHGCANIIKLKLMATTAYPVSERDVQKRLDLLEKGCIIEIVDNNAIWTSEKQKEVDTKEVDDILSQKPIK